MARPIQRSDSDGVIVDDEGNEVTFPNSEVTTGNVSAVGAAIVSSGSGAPASTPSKAGDIYIDTAGGEVYLATGNASSADWNHVSGISELVGDTTPQLGGNLDLNTYTIIDHVKGVDLQVHSGVLDNVAAYVTVTQAVDLDAIEARVNGLDAAVVLKGSWDASAGTFPGGGTAQAGESWIVSVQGTVDSQVFKVGDRIIAILDNASTTTYASNWLKADYTDVYQTASEILAALLTVHGPSSGLDADTLDTYEAAAFPRKAEAATISGAWTFSADPVVPAEAYGAGWNGSNEPPTKNDVYDKFEQTAEVTGAWSIDVDDTTDPAFAAVAYTGPQVDVLTGSGNYTVPASATRFHVVCISGGGGGGSGRLSASGACFGGGGGMAGLVSEAWFTAAQVGAGPIAYVVGAGGAGGTAQTVDATDGNNGGAGGASNFGTLLKTGAASGGSGGTASTGVGGSVETDKARTHVRPNGASAAAASFPAPTTTGHTGAGGAGGTISAGFEFDAGSGSDGTGGAKGSWNTNAAGSPGSPGYGTAGGGGGGGGDSNIGGAGYVGGAGGANGGGGGGGGGGRTTSSGAGGAGGAGTIVVIAW